MPWGSFIEAAPELAEQAQARWPRSEASVAMLATTCPDRGPHLAPVCPIFSGGGLYLSVTPDSPKCRDLTRDSQYVLHALPGPQDEEFQISGIAVAVADADARDRVHRDIPFPAFERSHPVFELRVARALAVTWRHWGTAEMSPERMRFVAAVANSDN